MKLEKQENEIFLNWTNSSVHTLIILINILQINNSICVNIYDSEFQ